MAQQGAGGRVNASVRTWALMRGGRIVNCVTTALPLTVVQSRYPGYEVADLYSLPVHVQEAYRYWDERP